MNSLKLLTRHIVKAALILLLLSCSIFAQQENVERKPNTSSDSVFVMQKSPWGAVLRSAIIPGWGQFYTKSYWKIPVIWGVGAWLVYLWLQNNRYYRDNLNMYNIYNQNYLSAKSDFDKQNYNYYASTRFKK